MEEEQKNIEVEDLIPVESRGIDIEEYEGSRVKIASVEIIDTTTSYNEKGEWVEGLKRPIKKMQVITESVGTYEDKEGLEVPIVSSTLYGLAMDKKTNKLGWSTHPNGKLNQLMTKLKVKTPKDLVGKMVTLTVRDRWLRIVI